MSGYRAYRVLRDRELRGEMCATAGTVVYSSKGYDYGLASDDSRAFGVRHISVTLSDEGDYPSFTIPFDDLEDIGPAPFARPRLPSPTPGDEDV